MGVFSTDHLRHVGAAEPPPPPLEQAWNDYGIVSVLALLLVSSIFLWRWRSGRSVKLTKLTGNRLLIAGGGLAVASVLMMENRYGSGLVSNILRGAEIMDSGLEARWPLLVAVFLISMGLFFRFGSKHAEDQEPPHE